MLDDNGIVDLELEGIPYWWDDGPRRAESDPIRHDLLRAAEVLGARHVKVTPDGDDAPWDREHWTAKFAELAAQCHDAGTRLGIEFFPWLNIEEPARGPAAGRGRRQTMRRVSSSTCGTSTGPTPRRRPGRRSAASHHRGRAQRRRRAGRGHVVRGHGAPNRTLPVGEALRRAAVSARRQLALSNRPA